MENGPLDRSSTFQVKQTMVHIKMQPNIFLKIRLVKERYYGVDCMDGVSLKSAKERQEVTKSDTMRQGAFKQF